MNIEIALPAAELLKRTLPGLAKVVSQSNALRALRCIRIARDNAGKVTLQATDLDAFVTYQLNQPQAGPPGQALVLWEVFRKTIKESRPTDRLGLVLDGQDCYLRSFVGQVPMEEKATAAAPDEWPTMPQLNGSAGPLDSRFKTVLPEALACTLHDSAQPTLQGVLLDVAEAGQHAVVATDKRHLYVANSFGFALQTPVILPRHKFLLWPGFLQDGAWSLRVRSGSETEGGWVELASQHWSFLGKTPEGPYPDWKQMVPAGAGTTRLVLSQLARDQVGVVLPRLPGWEAENQPVKLRVTPEQVLLCARRREENTWIEVPIPGVAISGQPVEVVFNRTFLSKALCFGLHELALVGPDAPLVFQAKDRKLVVACYKQEPTTPPAVVANETPAAVPDDPAPEPGDCNDDEDADPPAANPDTSPPAIQEQPDPDNDAPSEGAPSETAEVESLQRSLRDVLAQLQDMLPLLDTLETQIREREQELQSLREAVEAEVPMSAPGASPFTL